MQGVDALDLSGVHKRAPPSAHMANERLANGPEGGPDYTETNGAAWMPGFTCGGRSPKVEEGEEGVEELIMEGKTSARRGLERSHRPNHRLLCSIMLFLTHNLFGLTGMRVTPPVSAAESAAGCSTRRVRRGNHIECGGSGV